MRARAAAATIVTAFAISVLVFVANLGVWAQRQVLDPGALAVASLEALHEEDSEEAIASYLMDQAIEEVELLRIVREPGERAVGIVLASAGGCGGDERAVDEASMELTVPAIVPPPPDSMPAPDTLSPDSIIARDTARVP